MNITYRKQSPAHSNIRMKYLIYTIVAISATLGIIFIFQNADTNPMSDSAVSTSEANRLLEETYLLYAIDSSLLPYTNTEIPTIHNIATGTDTFGKFLELRLLPDQPILNKGIRSEISIDYPYNENDTVEYTWEFKIPTDFISDAPLNRWWLLADWHEQPDPTLGETWDTYESGSSPILFAYGNIDGADMIGLSTGSWRKDNLEFRGVTPITRGVWHKVRMVVVWSQNETGNVTVYLDDAEEPTFSVRGENMVNGYQHYMKIGQYRHPDIHTENSVFIKNISIQKL